MRFVYSLAASQVLVLALAFAVLGIALILGFILIRRLIRSRYFWRRDALTLYVRRNWRQIVNGEIPVERWFMQPMACEIVQEIVLDRVDSAGGQELTDLQSLLRVSGLLDRQIHAARQSQGWRRRKALVTLGRMQLPECVPALVEALEDRRDEVVIYTIRALGQIGNLRAGEAIFQRISRQPVACPAPSLETALANCFRGNASILLPLVLEAEDRLRPLLARVLAVIAAPGISGDVLTLTADPLADVRASAARILGRAQPPGAASALAELARDGEWFVRLRTMVALREIGDPSTIPDLIAGLCDSNRLVRLRAAATLASMEGHEERILHLATLTGDRYAMQALVWEMERSGRITRMVEDLASDERRRSAESGLRMAIAGGATRMIVNLISKGPGTDVRQNLARILAQSGDPALLRYVEQVRATADDVGQQALRTLVASIQTAHVSSAAERAPSA